MMIIKEHDDFEKIVKNLKEDKRLEIDLSNLNSELKIVMLNLICGYMYEKGEMKKISVDKFELILL